MPHIDLGEFTMFYEERGAGEPLVFLHGLSVDHRSWADQAAFFKDSYRVLVPDARGHGLSGITPSGYSRTDRVADLLRFLNSLGLGKVHLVGLSMGGSTAIGFALNHGDRLRSLTLAATAAAGYRPGKKFDRLDDIGRADGAEAAKRQWMKWALAWCNVDSRKHVGERLRMMIEDYSGAIWNDPMRGRYPREDDLSRAHEITAPTLIVVGQEDKIFLPLARQLRDLVSDSRLHEYEGVGHMVSMEAPHRFNTDLQAFLQGLKGKP
jgi:3-oxoadipate enol-lactonase